MVDWAVNHKGKKEVLQIVAIADMPYKTDEKAVGGLIWHDCHVMIVDGLRSYIGFDSVNKAGRESPCV